MVDEADEGKEYGLAGGGLDDGGFADSGGVEIDVCPFLRCLLLYIEI